MDSLILLLRQILVMFLYLGAGTLLFRFKKITKRGSAEMAATLLWLVLPAVIIKSCCVIPTAERVWNLVLSFAVSALLLVLAAVISRLFFRENAIDDFAGAFSNAGFIGIPLVSAALGEEAVFYIAPFIALLNLAQSTYGVARMSGKSIRLNRDLLKNPFVVSILIGLILFFTGLGAKLPKAATAALTGVSAMNAPLAMLVLGVYFAQTDPRSLVSDPKLYKVCLVRLIVVPAVSLVLCALLPIPKAMASALLIAASTPAGANVAVYAQLEGLDYAYASKTVVLSTLLSIATIPLVLFAAEHLI